MWTAWRWRQGGGRAKERVCQDDFLSRVLLRASAHFTLWGRFLDGTCIGLVLGSENSGEGVIESVITVIYLFLKTTTFTKRYRPRLKARLTLDLLQQLCRRLLDIKVGRAKGVHRRHPREAHRDELRDLALDRGGVRKGHRRLKRWRRRQPAHAWRRWGGRHTV